MATRHIWSGINCCWYQLFESVGTLKSVEDGKNKLLCYCSILKILYGQIDNIQYIIHFLFDSSWNGLAGWADFIQSYCYILFPKLSASSWLSLLLGLIFMIWHLLFLFVWTVMLHDFPHWLHLGSFLQVLPLHIPCCISVLNVCEVQPFRPFWLSVDLRLGALRSGDWWESLCVCLCAVYSFKKHGS